MLEKQSFRLGQEVLGGVGLLKLDREGSELAVGGDHLLTVAAKDTLLHLQELEPELVRTIKAGQLLVHVAEQRDHLLAKGVLGVLLAVLALLVVDL